MRQKNLGKNIARRIIKAVGGTGNPPEYGFQFFTAGLHEYLDVIEREYLDDHIKNGGSVFKLVIGIYGGGKTHFLYNVRELAWNHNYITSYIVLRPNETPFSKLELIYRGIVDNLIYKQSPEQLFELCERGIVSTLRKWFHEKYNEFNRSVEKELLVTELKRYVSDDLGPYDSISFKNAVKEAFIALLDDREADFNLILQWLKGEDVPKSELKKFHIYEKIDKTNAFKMIRSLIKWIKQIGYTGIVVLLDEGEQTPSMSTREKNLLLSNLRELVDACVHTDFRYSMWFYAVPDETFLEGQTNIYVALKQRLSTIFDDEINPTGIKIYLEKISIETIDLLEEIGQKLAKIYELAYDINFDDTLLKKTINNIATYSDERMYDIGVKRLFVQDVIKAFNILKRKGKEVNADDIL